MVWPPVSGWLTSCHVVTGAARNVSAWMLVCGRIGLSAVIRTRNRFNPCVQTACSCASAWCCLAMIQGLVSSMYLLASSASCMV